MNPTKKREQNKKQISLWTAGGALQLLAALLWIPQAWMLAGAIYAMMTGEAIWETAIESALWFVAIGVTRAALDALGNRLSYLRARQILTQMRGEALEALSIRSPLDIEGPTSGAAASVLAEQAETIVPYLSRYQPAKLKTVVAPWAILVAVAYHSWLAATILLFAAPLIPIFMALIGYGAQKASANQILEIGEMNGFLLDRLRGLATIRAFDGVEIIAKRLRTVSDTVHKKTMKVLSIAFLSSAVMELFSALGVAMVAAYIGLHLLGGNFQFGAWVDKMTLEQGMFILLLAPTFFEPLKELSAVWHDRAAGEAAAEALKKLSEQGVELVGNTYSEKRHNAKNPATDFNVKQPCQGALSVKASAISFQYPETTQMVLSNFSLQVGAGEKVALVAPSGYGKSTILALLAGLLPVNSGEIEVGGIVLNKETADTLRTHMGWISQQPHVFAGTLLHNITLGREHISQAQVEEAIATSALTSVAQGQLHRRLGEGGAGLSGGEVLRLALARAMVTPELGLLLADEPTAHLDSNTAQEVIDGLMALASKGVTLIMATHDERVLPYMDKVIRLEDMLMGVEP